MLRDLHEKVKLFGARIVLLLQEPGDELSLYVVVLEIDLFKQTTYVSIRTNDHPLRRQSTFLATCCKWQPKASFVSKDSSEA